MGKKKKSEYPHEIITDQGETIVKLIPASKAGKIHSCVLCEYETDFYEEHLLLLPVMFTGNRRYAHRDCYEDYKRNSSELIQMHPSAPNLSPEHLF